SHPTRLPGTPLLVTKSSQTAEGHRRSSPHQRIRPNSVARVRSFGRDRAPPPARPPVPAAPPAGSCRHWDLPRASRARDCPLRRSQSYSSLSLPILAAPSSVRSRDFGIVALAAPGRGLRRPVIGSLLT